MQKEIKDYPNYLIDSVGVVYINRQNLKQIKKLHLDKDGYLATGLSHQSMQKTKKVHRLVAEAFLTEWDNELEVNHIDGDKTNNCVENLEMVTHKENMLHAVKLELFDNRGEKQGGSKLKNRDILEIRDLINVLSPYIIADIYEVCPRTIYDIKHHKTWKNV